MMKFFREMDRLDAKTLDALHIHRSVHQAKQLVMIMPPLGAGLMMCHTASLLMGYVWTVASAVARSAILVFVLMTVLSVAFGFCWIHRAFCAYNLLVNGCIEFEKLIGFGALLTPARWFMIAVGVVLFALYFRRKWLYKNR